MTALFSLARTGTARSGVSLIVAAHKGGRSVRRKIAIIDIFRRFRHRTALIPTNLPIHYRRICGLTIDSTIYPAVGPLGRSISQQDQPLIRLSLSETPYSWRTGASRVMLLPDGPTAQVALWCALLDCSSPARGVKAEILVLRQASTRRSAARRPLHASGSTY